MHTTRAVVETGPGTMQIIEVRLEDNDQIVSTSFEVHDEGSLVAGPFGNVGDAQSAASAMQDKGLQRVTQAQRDASRMRAGSTPEQQEQSREQSRRQQSESTRYRGLER